MLPSKKYPVSLTANATTRILVSGNFFKILSATGAVDVRSNFGKLEALIYGQGLEKTPFDYLELRDASGAANDIVLFIGDENFIDGLTGNFAITANVPVRSSGYSNTQATVTTASAQLAAANTTRSALAVQNKDLSGTIYLTFGVAATVANGIKVGPGQYWEPPPGAAIPTNVLNAIGDIASNANVVVLQG